MKKIVFLILFLSTFIMSQALYNPYETRTWDAPYAFTGDSLSSPSWSLSWGYYDLGIFTLGSNPGGWLNKNFWQIDSLMESLVVYIDTTQFRLRNDTLMLAIDQTYDYGYWRAKDNANDKIVVATHDDVSFLGTGGIAVAIDDQLNTITVDGSAISPSIVELDPLSIHLDGSKVMNGDINLGGFSTTFPGFMYIPKKTTNPSISGDASLWWDLYGRLIYNWKDNANDKYYDSLATLRDIRDFTSTSYLPLAGGVMSGDINMGLSDISNIDNLYIPEKITNPGLDKTGTMWWNRLGNVSYIWRNNSNDKFYDTLANYKDVRRIIQETPITIDSILALQFTPTDTATIQHNVGLVFFDSTSSTLALYVEEPDITQSLGQEFYVRAYNNTVSTISNGTAVAFTGSISGIPTIDLADASSHETDHVIGLVTHDIEASTYGYVTKTGAVHGLVTSGYTEGDIIYLSSTPGEWTNVPPDAPNSIIRIGAVLSVDATEGIVYVETEIPNEIDGFISVYWNDEAETIALTEDVEVRLTNSTNTLFTTDTDVTQKVTESNDSLYINQAGSYLISVAMSFEGGNGGLYKAYIKHDGVALPYTCSRSTSSSDVGSMSFNGVVKADAGDNLTIWIINTESATDYEIVSGSIMVQQVR